MKKTYISEQIKCDTVLCGNLANIKLTTNSYKGDTFLCSKCLSELKCLFKKEK